MRKLFSVDLELSGLIIGKHSALSLGACFFHEPRKSVYTEIIPVSSAYDDASMRIAALGLSCSSLGAPYDPCVPHFSPSAVLEYLSAHGMRLSDALESFSEWIRESCDDAVLCSLPLKVERAWLSALYNDCGLPFPFSSGLCLHNLAIKEDFLELPDTEHNALADALVHADYFSGRLSSGLLDKYIEKF